jgi:hypothetical protein
MGTTELKVLFKGEDWTFNKKFLVYEDFSLKDEDPKVQECIKDAQDCVKLTPDDVSFKITKVVR